MDIVFTKDAFADKLIHIATEVASEYKNKYPYNCGYYNANGRFSWDCWNLVKSLVWGWQENRSVGYFCYQPDLYGLGDWDGGTIMSYCDDVSESFNRLVKGEFLLTADKGHAGVYVGEFTDRLGQTCNVVECTMSWNENKVIGSWVDPDGKRYNCMGGVQDNKRTNWYRHGKLPWVDYAEQPQPQPVPPEPKPDVIVVDGSWGFETTKYTQIMFGTNPDSVISNQPWYNKRFLPNAYKECWQFHLFASKVGSDIIKAIQTFLRDRGYYYGDIDGWCGKQTVMAIQAFLADCGYYTDTIDGSMGYNTVCAWQTYVNNWFKAH